MKSITFAAIFTAIVLHVNADKKLALITGINGGLLTGLNPGLAVGGVNPALLNGGGLIGQTPFMQVVPGIPTMFMQPPGVPVAPLPLIPNLGMQQQQPVLGQGVPPANGGQTYYVGVPQPNVFGAQQGLNPTLQQVSAIPAGNANQPQAVAPARPMLRYKRSFLRKACTEKPLLGSQVTQIAPTPTAAGDKPITNLLNLK